MRSLRAVAVRASLAGFAFGAETVVGGFEDGVVLGGDKGGHPQHGAHGGASTGDVALAAAGQTFAGKLELILQQGAHGDQLLADTHQVGQLLLIRAVLAKRPSLRAKLRTQPTLTTSQRWRGPAAIS